ncbi:MAG TPA: hypothetical protein VFE40_15320 [Jatrophihabitantaceae bacterium]|nr:hypothetical protein [Jatrophihabitantaceae bacterium]
MLAFDPGQPGREGRFDGVAFAFHRPLQRAAGVGEPEPHQPVVVFVRAPHQQPLLAEHRRRLRDCGRADTDRLGDLARSLTVPLPQLGEQVVLPKP